MARAAWCPHCRKYVPVSVAKAHYYAVLETRRQAAQEWAEETDD